jgi:hypothetical protein
MTEVQGRRQRRSSTGGTATAAAVAPNPANHQALDAFLAQLRDLERAGEFDLLGRIGRIQVMRPEGPKTLDFRQEGPIVSRVKDSDQLLVTTRWKGLPAKWDDTEKFCPDCLSTCDVCGGAKKKACEAYQCGGSGKVRSVITSCTAPGCHADSGQPIRACSVCHGTGNYSELTECAVCKGTGKMVCGPCRGTGQRPTGIEGGSTNWRDPACPRCLGSKFDHQQIPQDLEQFVNARHGDLVAVGPIIRFTVESIGGTGAPPRIFDVVPDGNEQYLALLLSDNATVGAHAYLVGGILS